MKIGKITCVLGLAAVLLGYGAPDAFGTEAQSADATSRAAALEKQGKWESAAKAYMAAELYSDEPNRKADSLLRAARAYRKAGFLGSELDCLIRLTDEHINRIDFTMVVSRMYTIGDAFFDGHHDVVVTWLPFIYDKDRTEEAYEVAVKNAPCAKQAASARLRLGVLYMESGRHTAAIEKFQEVMRLHPETRTARHANVQLANLYCKLSEIGDGDGKWSKRAIEILDALIRDYPDDPQIPWAKQQRSLIDSRTAKRLHGLAEYYHRTGQDNVAQRYLTRVIRNYGATADSMDSERLLAEIDKSYVPPEKNAVRKQPYRMTIQRNTIPLERTTILTVPENSDGRFLLPVQDLGMDVNRDSRNNDSKGKLEDDEI